MTALSASNPSITGLTPSRYNYFPVAASTTIYMGAMVVLNYLGQAIAAAGALGSLQGHMRVIGVSQGRCAPGAYALDGTADAVAVSAGDYNVQVETGKFNFINGSASNGGAATDTIVAADILGYAYAQDDATVSRDSLDGDRPCVGIIRAILDDGTIDVEITGERWFSTVMSYKADADLSLLRNSQVKVDDSSGAARVDSAATDTTRSIGILINAPDAANKVALVVISGPAPCVVGASNIVAADKVAATTAGASIAAGAAKTFVGHAMQTGTSAQTKMILVQPGVMPA